MLIVLFRIDETSARIQLSEETDRNLMMTELDGERILSNPAEMLTGKLEAAFKAGFHCGIPNGVPKREIKRSSESLEF